jgi:mRNA export factor
MSAFGAQKINPQASDIDFPNAASDGISSLAMNGNPQEPTNIVVAGSWDCSVTCYELSRGGGNVVSGIQAQGQIKHEAPVMCTAFSADPTTCFSGGCDGSVYMWNVTQGSQAAQKIGKHDQPIRCMTFVPEINMLATGSWDKSIRLWDCRQPQPAMTIPVSDRVYCMDVKNKILVAATGDLQVHAFPDITNPAGQHSYKSPLSYQSRSINVFQDGMGFALGCIEGRVAIEYFSELNQRVAGQPKQAGAQSFIFKCHRQKEDIYAINDIHFHKYNTFLTAGSDGVITWWDKDARSKLDTKDRMANVNGMIVPIVAAKFTPLGDAMIYAASYDWSKGADYAPQYSQHNYLGYHPIVDDTKIRPKMKK